jgi:hypothetical protein
MDCIRFQFFDFDSEKMIANSHTQQKIAITESDSIFKGNKDSISREELKRLLYDEVMTFRPQWETA